MLSNRFRFRRPEKDSRPLSIRRRQRPFKRKERNAAVSGGGYAAPAELAASCCWKNRSCPLHLGLGGVRLTLMLETTDEFTALLARTRQGDKSAVAEVVQRYEHIIHRAARALLGPQMRPFLDSLDIVQSVHRSLLIGVRREKFEIASTSGLIALALTMVRRKIARHWRKLQHQPRFGSPPTIT